MSVFLSKEDGVVIGSNPQHKGCIRLSCFAGLWPAASPDQPHIVDTARLRAQSHCRRHTGLGPRSSRRTGSRLIAVAYCCPLKITLARCARNPAAHCNQATRRAHKVEQRICYTKTSVALVELVGVSRSVVKVNCPCQALEVHPFDEGVPQFGPVQLCLILCFDEVMQCMGDSKHSVVPKNLISPILSVIRFSACKRCARIIIVVLSPEECADIIGLRIARRAIAGCQRELPPAVEVISIGGRVLRLRIRCDGE
eukprot:7376921-Prymnesium_polylepis.6